MTNAGGFVTHSATYEPYGGLLEDFGTSSSLGFTGEMHDSTGLVYLRARYADPVTGTFLTRDPVIGQIGGMSIRWNPYTYAGANPVNYTDPDGRFFFLPLLIGAVIGAALAGAINVATQLSQNGGRLDCLNKEELGMAMLEGMVMGAVSGMMGGLTGAAGLTGLAAAIPAAIVDFGAGVIWDKLVRNVSDEEAITNGITNIAFGAAVDALSKPFAKMLSKAARMIKDKVADTRMGRWMRMGAKSACSFSADTTVATENGDRPISELKEGDKVLAYHEATGETGEYEVTAVHVHTDEVIVYLIIDGELIETTPEHPFYVENKGWTAAGDLQFGDVIQSADGTNGTVETVAFANLSQVMYNLTVDEAHTFFVGEREWLVHNLCPIDDGGGLPPRQKGFDNLDGVDKSAWNKKVHGNSAESPDALVYMITRTDAQNRTSLFKYGTASQSDIIGRKADGTAIIGRPHGQVVEANSLADGYFYDWQMVAVTDYKSEALYLETLFNGRYVQKYGELPPGLFDATELFPEDRLLLRPK